MARLALTIPRPPRARTGPAWRRPLARGGAALLVLGALAATAYDSPAPLAKVPPHLAPWLEMKTPDIPTVLLWNFPAAADKAGALDDLLATDPTGTGGETTEAGLARLTEERAAPRLTGGARVVAGAGRFGGGLQLDGTGAARADKLDLRALLIDQGGTTLDLWVRPAATAADAPPQCLLALPDATGKDALSLRRGAAGELVVAWRGDTVLTHPRPLPADMWSHVTLVLTTTGAPRNVSLDQVMVWTSLQVGVNGYLQPAERPAWLNGGEGNAELVRRRCFAKTIGNVLVLGGGVGDGAAGWRGSVDAVRLSRGIRYFYPWDLGWQERPVAAPIAEAKPPFFQPGQVLTRFTFDGTLEPAAFAGRSWTGKADASHFRPGLRGQALDLSRVGETGFGMKGFYVLPEENGSIEFWFRPLDWHNFYLGEYDGRDVPYTWLMTLTAKDARGGTPTKNLEAIRGRACRDANLHWQQFHPGRWTHVLIAVKDRHPAVYVNGRPQKLWQAGLVLRGHPYSREPLEEWRKRTGGKDTDDTWTTAFVQSPTLVDEFSVYSWPLTAEEAWNAYARWLPDASKQMQPLPTFRPSFDYFAHSWDRQEKLVIALACLPVNGVVPASADLELRDAAGAVLLTAERQALDATGKTSFTLKRALPFGRYPVTLRARDAAGAVLKEESREYVRARPAWLENTLGEERTVPPPWTPIAVDGPKLRVIGRELELGANGLPARITTLDQPLLAAPATVRVTAAAGVAELTGAGPRFTETAPDRVAWQAALAGGGVAADLAAWLEFDGLLYVALTLKPAAGDEAKLDALTVDVPLRPERATQLLANGGGNNFRAAWLAKFLPAGAGRVWHSSEQPYPAFVRALGVTNFMPHLWLGGDDAGLYVGAENDQGWTVDGPQPAQEIRREGDAVVLRLNIIREPTTLPAAGRRCHFVLLPTPAKPEPPDWRQQMLGGVNFGSCDTFGGFDLKTDPADPGQGDGFLLEPRSWEHAAAMAPQCRAKWGRCILYTDASWPRPGPAFADWNHDLWAGTGRLAWTPECEDYAVWAINEFLRRGLIDGVYWDDVSVGYTLSLASTAYEYAGSANGRRVGFTALAQRRVNQRLWRLFTAAGREPGIWAHMTVCYEVPLFSFCRYLSNCEFVTGVDFPGKRDAMDMWSPDTLRLLGGAAKWGVGYHCLSTLPRSLADTPAAKQWAYPQQRTETALYVTSDVMQIPDGLARVLVKERVFAGPVRAYPWWRAAQVVNVAAPAGAGVRAGVYVAERRAVVIVANWDREEREVTVELKDGAGLPASAAVSWRDLDPGLTPPAAVVASAADVARVEAGAGHGDLTGTKDKTDDVAVRDLLDGTTPEGRALARLTLRTEGRQARVVIRPRDYRVLEARPAP